MNQLAPVNAGSSALAIANTQKAIAEVQAAMVLARQFPRDEVRAIERIKNAFSRNRLAEAATYIYTRGGSDVTGPSIRAAEAIAQAWGNVQFGFREIERGIDKGIGYSEVEAYAWDIETNTKRALQFRIKHLRQTKKGTTPLTEERDIYEHIANHAQRRVRACIIAVVPGDVFEEALAVAYQTVNSNVDMSPEKMKTLLETFEGIGISKKQIEQKFGRSFEALQPGNVIQLRNIYRSIKDGMGKPQDYFPPVEEPKAEAKPAGRTKVEEMKAKLKPKPEEATVSKKETVDQETGEVLPAAGISFANVADMITKADSQDALDIAMDNIRYVKDDVQQQELYKLAEQKSEAYK